MHLFPLRSGMLALVASWSYWMSVGGGSEVAATVNTAEVLKIAAYEGPSSLAHATFEAADALRLCWTRLGQFDGASRRGWFGAA